MHPTLREEFWMIPMPEANLMVIPLVGGLFLFICACWWIANRFKGKPYIYSRTTDAQLDEKMEQLHKSRRELQELYQQSGNWTQLSYRLKHGEDIAKLLKSL
jgi:hypothetical protein